MATIYAVKETNFQMKFGNNCLILLKLQRKYPQVTFETPCIYVYAVVCIYLFQENRCTHSYIICTCFYWIENTAFEKSRENRSDGIRVHFHKDPECGHASFISENSRCEVTRNSHDIYYIEKIGPNDDGGISRIDQNGPKCQKDNAYSGLKKNYTKVQTTIKEQPGTTIVLIHQGYNLRNIKLKYKINERKVGTFENI